MSVNVKRSGHAALTAQQAVDRHPGSLAFDVPQRHVDAGKCVVQDRPTSPVRAHLGGVKDIFNLINVAAAEQWIKIALTCLDNGQWSLGECGAPQTVKPRFACLDFDHYQPYPVRSCLNTPNPLNAHRVHVSPSRLLVLSGFEVAPRPAQSNFNLQHYSSIRFVQSTRNQLNAETQYIMATSTNAGL